MQRQTAVTTYLKSKQFLLFAYEWQTDVRGCRDDTISLWLSGDSISASRPPVSDDLSREVDC